MSPSTPPRRFTWSMRLALTVWNVATLAAILLILSLTVRYTLKVSLIHQIDNGLSNSARGIAPFLASRPELVLGGAPHGPNRFGQPGDDNDGAPGPPGDDTGRPRAMPSDDGANQPGAGPPPPQGGDSGGYAMDDAAGEDEPPPPVRPNRGDQSSQRGALGPGQFGDQGQNRRQGPGPGFDPVSRWRNQVYQRRTLPTPPVYLTPKCLPFPVFPWMVAYDPAAARKAASGQTTYTDNVSGGNPIRVISFPISDGKQIFAVCQLARPESDELNSVRTLQNTLWLLLPLGLIVAGIGGLLLASAAMRPVGEIARRTAKIGTKQLSERLPVNGGDEFALLAQTINGMLGRIEEGYRELTESYKQQQRFTADASHELRTPLAVIKANTSLALMGTRSSDEYRQALVNSDKAATRMGRIVQDLLLLTRADAAQPTLRLAPTEIWDVLEQVAEAFHDTGGASVCLEKGSARPVISADADALVRVFTNLVENAVRHTPATGSVTIDASQSENLVLVRVTDTGEGIAPEHLPHLMERFYRVDSDRNRSKGGTGLGLAICKTIVEQHHGSISIESIVGAGTKVTVALPLENQNKFSSGAT